MGPLRALLGSVGTMLLALALMLGGPMLCLVLQARALWRRQGAWRLAALPPLLLLTCAAVSHAARLLSEGSNLAPMIVILVLPVALLCLAVAGALRNRRRR